MDGTAYYLAAIIGTFVSLALAVNGYFIKSLLESLNQVKIQTATLLERSDNKEARLSKLEIDFKELLERIHTIEKDIN